MKFYITTPIYYVNDKPHIGHAYTTITADVLARHHREQGDEVFLLTGTDEHGSKIAEAAQKAGQEPQEFCDSIASNFQETWRRLNISNDKFIRTTDKEHIKAVQKFVVALKGADALYEKEYEGLYCSGCEKFLTDKELVNGKCPDHNIKPKKIKEKNWFFKLSEYLPKIKKLIESDKIKVGPAHIKKEVLSLISKQELPDFSFSRRKVSWGIELPWDKDQTVYVWADALPNYISAIGYENNQKQFEEWWNNAQVSHFMAKDILKFHAIYWPAMLLAADIKVPENVYAHGFFTINGQKMSKTLGNFINPIDLVDKFGIDATRYLLLSQFPFGQDGDISEKRFIEKYNADLANNLGNLISRASNLIEKSKLEFRNFKVKSDKFEKQIDELYSDFRFDEVLKLIWQKIDEANLYLNKKEPWKIKDKDKLKKIFSKLIIDIQKIAKALVPFMPETAEKILEQFSQPKIKKQEILFPRIK